MRRKDVVAMTFEKHAIVTNLWINKVNFRETKAQYVSGRSFHSVSFRLSGEVAFEVNGKPYLSSENGITFMPADVNYITQVRNAGAMFIIHFKALDGIANAQPLFLNNRADLRRVCEALCDSYWLDAENPYRCMSLLYAILDALSKSHQVVPRRIRSAKNRLDTQFSEMINIADLAKEAGVSEVHFRNEFKRYYGISPLHYLKQVRIDNAKQLLRSGYYTVTDAAMECGFENISYFSSEFKRLTGTTPTQYIQHEFPK